MRSDLLKELRNQRSSWALFNVLLISFSTTSLIRNAVLKALTTNFTGRCVPTQCRTQLWQFCRMTFLQTVCWHSLFCEMVVQRHCVASALWMQYSLQANSDPDSEVQMHPSSHDWTYNVWSRIHVPSLLKCLFFLCVFFFLLLSSSAMHFLGQKLVGEKRKNDGDGWTETSVSQMVSQDWSSDFQSVKDTSCLLPAGESGWVPRS